MSATVYPFNDGYLISVTVGEGLAVLGLKQVDGSEFKMTLTGVEAFVADGFREGNIILDLRSVSGGRPAGDELGGDVAETMEALFPGPHDLAATHYRDLHASVVETKLDRLSAGEAALVILTPSYGADVLAYCASVEIEPPLCSAQPGEL